MIRFAYSPRVEEECWSQWSYHAADRDTETAAAREGLAYIPYETYI
jgi:hypothetical protein